MSIRIETGTIRAGLEMADCGTPEPTWGKGSGKSSIQVVLPQTCLQGGSACTGAAVRRKL